MGQKGDKHTDEAQLSTNLLVEKLTSIGGITSKKMFGGHGIFHEGKMFGIIDSKGKTFLKTSISNEQQFVEVGSEKHGKMPYYSLPEEVLNNPDKLIDWSTKSIELSKA